MLVRSEVFQGYTQGPESRLLPADDQSIFESAILKSGEKWLLHQTISY